MATETAPVAFNKLERKMVAQALRQVIREMKDAARYEGERHDLEIRIAESALNKVKA